MALTNTLQWRIRTGGSDTNGGGFDATTAGTLSTTLTAPVAPGDTTINVASATGWPAAANYYAQIGNAGAEATGGSSEIVLVTGGQGTTAWTVTRGQLGTTALAAASGVAVTNEVSRCNTAPFSGSLGVSTASTTFTDASGGFNETVVGNVLWLASGTGSPTAGPYLVTGFTNSTTITLDRASGTYTAGAWTIGGAWASTVTNVQSSAAILLPGNQVFIRASGSGSVASPDYTGTTTTPSGDTTNGFIRFIGENGRPYVLGSGSNASIFQSGTFNWFDRIYGIAAGATSATNGIFGQSANTLTTNCTADQNGFDVHGLRNKMNLSCEVLSSTVNSGAAGTNAGYFAIADSWAINCNIHDCWGVGVNIGIILDIKVIGCIIAKCAGDGIVYTSSGGGTYHVIYGNTIDGNGGNGILINNASAITSINIFGNIISNHTNAGKFGLNVNAGTTAVNDRLRSFIDYNSYYNNTGNAQNLTVGSGMVNGIQLHDNVGIDPQYAGQSTENYVIGANLKALGFPQLPFLQSLAGQTTGVQSYVDPGAVQRQEPANTIVPQPLPSLMGQGVF